MLYRRVLKLASKSYRNNTSFLSTFGYLNDYWSRLKESVDYNLVQPGLVSPMLGVPKTIRRPAYAETGHPEERPAQIDIKEDEAVLKMRQSCALAKRILNEASKHLKVGMPTNDIDVFVHDACIRAGAYPSPLNYHDFPKSVCTSVNNVACHGIPDDRPLQPGDILTIDVSVFLNNCHGDCASTYAIGEPDEKALRLMKITEDCLLQAIDCCRPGQRFSKIGQIIQKHANKYRFNVVRCFCGHGIGTYFHGPPEILHYSNKEPGVMEEGMIFTIEPVISEGKTDIVVLEDGWTAVTLDNSRTAQYEHTVLITKTGVDILTL